MAIKFVDDRPIWRWTIMSSIYLFFCNRLTFIHYNSSPLSLIFDDECHSLSNAYFTTTYTSHTFALGQIQQACEYNQISRTHHTLYRLIFITKKIKSINPEFWTLFRIKLITIVRGFGLYFEDTPPLWCLIFSSIFYSGYTSYTDKHCNFFFQLKFILHFRSQF